MLIFSSQKKNRDTNCAPPSTRSYCFSFLYRPPPTTIGRPLLMWNDVFTFAFRRQFISFVCAVVVVLRRQEPPPNFISSFSYLSLGLPRVCHYLTGRMNCLTFGDTPWCHATTLHRCSGGFVPTYLSSDGATFPLSDRAFFRGRVGKFQSIAFVPLGLPLTCFLAHSRRPQTMNCSNIFTQTLTHRVALIIIFQQC